jgi:AcrR family transcriptional regulator
VRLVGSKRSRASAEDRLNEILRVAASNFKKNGYRGTRLDDIADELGVTRAALYYYFRNKQEILEILCSENMAAAEAIVAAVQEYDDPAERLTQFIRLYAPVITSDSAYIFFRDRSELRPAFRRVILSRARRLTDAVETLVKEGMADGVIRKDLRPRLTAAGILGMLNWTAQWFDRSGSASIEELSDAYADLIWRGLRSDTQGTDSNDGQSPDGAA